MKNGLIEMVGFPFHCPVRVNLVKLKILQQKRVRAIAVLCNKLLLPWKAVFYWMLYKLDGQAVLFKLRFCCIRGESKK